MKNGLPVLLMFLVLGSCTIEKRLYNKGFYVEFRQKRHPLNDHHASTSPEDSEKEADMAISESSSKIPGCSGKVLLSPVDEYNKVESIPAHSEKQLSREQSLKSATIHQTSSVITLKATTLTDDSPVNKNGNSVKKEKMQKKPRERQEISLSEEAFEFLTGAVLLTILLLCMAFPTFGAIVEMIVGIVLLILLVAGVVWVIGWLCTADFGNFPWFWSGR